MNLICSLLVLAFFSPAFAFETDPNNMVLLQCMALYDFDFVAAELGFKIDMVDRQGRELPAPSEAERSRISLTQAEKFLTTGKLTPRVPNGEKHRKSDREMARRCQIIAEAVMQASYLRGRLAPEDSDDKSGPHLLEQSF